MIVISTFILPVSALESNTGNIIVHYYNENNWDIPYIYYYYGSNEGTSWPGEAMISEGNNWYVYEISGYSKANVIFSNNGSEQYPAQNEAGLEIEGEKWYMYSRFFNQNPDDSKITVHYYNKNNWNVPYIYYYSNSEIPVNWPGLAMTYDGNGWYSYNIYGFEAVNVIFSDSGSSQIPSQNQEGYQLTHEGCTKTNKYTWQYNAGVSADMSNNSPETTKRGYTASVDMVNYDNSKKSAYTLKMEPKVFYSGYAMYGARRTDYSFTCTLPTLTQKIQPK